MSATAATTAASREERHGQAPPKKSFASKITAKHLFSSLITFLLVIGEVQFKILGGYDRLALALGTCMLTEVVLSRLLRKAWPQSVLSAYISGNSLAILAVRFEVGGDRLG